MKVVIVLFLSGEGPTVLTGLSGLVGLVSRGGGLRGRLGRPFLG